MISRPVRDLKCLTMSEIGVTNVKNGVTWLMAETTPTSVDSSSFLSHTYTQAPESPLGYFLLCDDCTLGGFVRVDDEIMAMTCHHVVQNGSEFTQPSLDSLDELRFANEARLKAELEQDFSAGSSKFRIGRRRRRPILIKIKHLMLIELNSLYCFIFYLNGVYFNTCLKL